MPTLAQNPAELIDQKSAVPTILKDDKTITYRQANKDDYESIAALHKKNYKDPAKLTEQDKNNGFLSVIFTPQQFKEMNEDLAVVVAVQHGEIIGYVCGASFDYCQRFPLLKETIDFIDSHQLKIDGKSMSGKNTFFYGPVCIAEGKRGQGILEGLFEALKVVAVKKQYDNCALFMSFDNKRSYRAHRYRLNMRYVDTFFSGGKQKHFLVLARELFDTPNISKAEFGAKLHSGEVPTFTIQDDQIRANNVNYRPG